MADALLPVSGEASHKVAAVRAFKTISGMPQNFLACDREQPFLLPPRRQGVAAAEPP